MARQYKNNIFDVIKQLDNKNYNYYSSLSDEQKKEIQPYTLMRWMSTISGDETSHEILTLMINENVNKHFWEISKYKDLEWKLLCGCGIKKPLRHQWIASSKTSLDKQYNIIRNFYSDLNDEDFEIKYKSLNLQDIQHIYEYLGLKDK